MVATDRPLPKESVASSRPVAAPRPLTKILCRTAQSEARWARTGFPNLCAKENGNGNDPDSPARQGYGDQARAVHELRAERQAVEGDGQRWRPWAEPVYGGSMFKSLRATLDGVALRKTRESLYASTLQIDPGMSWLATIVKHADYLRGR